MAVTLQIPSFADVNIRERTGLSAVAAINTQSLTLQSTEGFVSGSSFYIGQLGRERCELAVVDTVSSSTQLTVVDPLQYTHPIFEPVASVVGPRIRIYRAVNIDGRVSPDGSFAVLATRSIDPDQETTYYTDSSGSSDYWYRFTYFNELTAEETALSDSQPVRGDDFGHYASISAIRKEAGFEHAPNLSPVDVDQQRRAAEGEINAALGSYYTVPFVKPVPEIIRIITEKLAAGFLLSNAFGRDSTAGLDKVTEARAMIKSFIDGSGDIGDGSQASGVDGYPDTEEPRMFSIEDVY